MVYLQFSMVVIQHFLGILYNVGRESKLVNFEKLQKFIVHDLFHDRKEKKY